ncbi:MAG TPA: hypothetical protein VIG33_17505 [Pseudobdellovibrionaceae bacterium]|jgi:hypothetical protein
MKNKLIAFMLMASFVLILANCSKSNSTPANSAIASGVCTVPGQIYTTQGCLPQSSACGMNAGYLNGSCYPAAGMSGVNSMCGTGSYGYNNQNYGNTGYTQTNCYPQQGYQQQGTCLSTDVVNTQMGTLTVGVCQPYCAQYGRKYGYSNGSCYPAY